MVRKSGRRSRVFILGLDGSRLDIIKKWVGEGSLPNLKKLIEEGSSGDLRTIFPPHSMLAWTSFMTGTNPGKHGIYNIQLQSLGTYEQRVPNSTKIKDKTIFQILSEKGLIVGSINIPMTYPPIKVNGVTISSWLTPPMANYSYPKKVQNEINKMGYKIQPSVLNKNKPGFEKEVYDTTEKRFEAAIWFMKKYDWDFISTLVTGTEHMHHNYAAFFDPEHPDYEERQELIIKRFYRFVDKKIGELIKFLNKKYGNSVDLIIMSDHGFGPSYGKIYLNNVLKKHGFFVEKKKFNLSGGAFEWLEESGVANKMRNLLGTGFFDKMPKFIKNKIEAGRSSDVQADWSKTRAYCTSILGDIRINLDGREPSGIVRIEEYEKLRDEIIEKIKKDKTIGKYIEGVHKRESLYSGPEVENIADLFVEFKKCCTSSPKTPKSKFIGIRKEAGFHTMEGLIIARGPRIKRGFVVKGAEIIDISPTVMALFGFKPDKNMDGKVLSILKGS